jgi:hypothetical protein
MRVGFDHFPFVGVVSFCYALCCRFLGSTFVYHVRPLAWRFESMTAYRIGDMYKMSRKYSFVDSSGFR